MINFRKERARNALKNVNMKEHAYVVILIDKEDGFSKYIYVKRGENINDYITYNPNSSFIVDEVYNLNLDIESQLNEDRSYHVEKIDNKNFELEEVLKFAKEKHKGQMRKGYHPKEYITHPINVCSYINKYRIDCDYIDILKKAAYLHDTIEDTNTTYEEIFELYGAHVASLVLELTTDKKMKNILGKKRYLALKMTHMSKDALDLKLCDRLDNVIGLYDTDDEFREKYTNETLYIINYLKNNRELDETQITIIKDILIRLSSYENKEKRAITYGMTPDY